MVHQKIYEAYYFTELSKEAQAHALDNLRDINVDFDNWAEFELDEAKKNLEAQGYREPEIAYSGFANQGDGASFTCKSIDVLQWLKAHKMSNQYRRIYAAIKADWYIHFDVVRTSHQYSHEYTVSVSHEVDYGAPDAVEEQAAQLQEAILADVQENSRGIYKSLYDNYFGLISDEAVKDTIEANEYEFNKSGDLI